MSTAIAKNLQVGSDPTATNNFTIFQPATPDGTLRIGNGNTGITSSLLTLTSGGNFGIGTSSPAFKVDARGSSGTGISFIETSSGNSNRVQLGTGSGFGFINADAGAGTIALALQVSGSTRATLDSSGNLGLGVTPSAWVTIKGFEIAGLGNAVAGYPADAGIYVSSNAYYGTGGWRYGYSSKASTLYSGEAGAHSWKIAPSGTAGNAISFTQAMTLDASGNLLLGTTTSAQRLTVKGTSTGALSLVFNGSSAVMVEVNGSSTINGVDGSPNGNGLMRVWRDSGNLRSISAAGTINASGADYAEYMTKAGDFTVAKGDVVGINAEGKLTNVFADALSFCVKSTDPSYVGGDAWGAGLEGDALEEARQAVDRIAFSGQVPVNVTGASAGQYIIPVNENGAIKGEAVSNPTFEQYQQAVGKVISIDADGRARIIVKIA